MIAKQHAKREQIQPVCLHATEKYEKGESVNTQNDYKKASKKWTVKKKHACPVSFVKLIKFWDNMFKTVQKNFQEMIVKKIFLENPPVTMAITW